ncbi:outer membrane chaperone Skp (OmpH) [Isosphaera pallida ATCC 43644]|jgi:outer membrane protein|uniref:Outer membrane chaperone Skp (OmpH) n=1 Tax=Isosphaera pallida (strain ATCC 43644 / DSM 9630 / IS1B) TaxID=575540 RepID=E8R1R8_ISOPI|nr:OmpH family outer membrane protein [Isosphaera pallida]ADV61340.1 outer membrane chaperone Skp (OmpH) [Isosphaera pallida ATCC 43644]
MTNLGRFRAAGWMAMGTVLGVVAIGPILQGDPLRAQQGGTATNANAAAQRKSALPPCVVATIDMDAVFKGYERVKVSSDEFKAAAMAEQQKLVKLTADIKAQVEKLSKLAVGSPDYKKLESEITEAQARHEALRQQAEREFSRREADSLAVLYKEIQDMAARVAQYRGFSHVVQISREPVSGSDPQRVFAAMGRTVVYSDPRFDITNDVILNLNHVYQQQSAPKPDPNAAQAGAPGN